MTLLHDDAAGIYADDVEPTGLLVVAAIDVLEWAVKLSSEGRIVTAFPLADPAVYLADPRRRYIGTAGQLIPS